MGNRAFMAFNNNEDGNGIYLHWNGSRESVEAFLRAARDLDLPDSNEGHKKLHEIIEGTFGAAHFRPNEINASDNGVYVISGYQVVERRVSSYESLDVLIGQDHGYDMGDRAKRGHEYYDSAMDHPEAKMRLAFLRSTEQERDLNATLAPARSSAEPSREREDLGAPDPQPLRPNRPRL